MGLDPIEKKPLARYRPGSLILSVGSYGCNLRCPFCQNHAISQCGADEQPWEALSPAQLAQKARQLEGAGNIGLAFTYNEPAVGWEYVRDAAAQAKALGLASVMVTNGCFSLGVMAALAPFIDAWNIDLKCFSEAGYRSIGGELAWVKASIQKAAAAAHLEVTCLVVPGFSDDAAQLEQMAGWLAGISPDIPLHLSRYFPRWQATAPATPIPTMRRLERLAKKHLQHVFMGNM